MRKANCSWKEYKKILLMKAKDDFINVSLSTHNVDRYYHRKSIFEALKKNLKYFEGKLLDAGCGKMPYKEYILKNSNTNEYIGLDIEDALNYSDSVKPDVTWDGKKMPFEESSFDCVFTTEVLEHVPVPLNFLKEINRVLKPGGVFFFTTPFLWPLHETPHDEYRYTPFAMERLLKETGFSNIKIEAFGGWNASLGQMLGLWLRRGPLSRRKKKVLTFAILPLLRYLYKSDNSKVDFLKNPMITGIFGLARKND